MNSFGKFILLVIVYFVSGKLGLLLAVPPGYATAIWPPSGFALAGLLIYGYRFWPSIWFGSILVNAGTSLDPTSPQALIHSLLPVVLIGLGASLQALLGAFLIRKFIDQSLTLEKDNDVYLFLTLGGPVSCLVSCSIGILTLMAFGVIQFQEASFSWFTWWVGDSIGVSIFAPLMMIFMAQPRDVWRKRKIKVALPMMVAFFIVVVLFVLMKNTQEKQVRERFNGQAKLIISALENNFDRYLDILYSIRSFYQSSQNVERDEFSHFVANALERYKAVVALVWSPKIIQEGRGAFEESVRQEGIEGFQIMEMGKDGKVQTSSVKDIYFPITFAEPVEMNSKVMGFDFMSEASRKKALDKAWVSGEAALTQPLRLIQGPLGEVAFLGVYDNHVELGSNEDRLKHLKGFVVAVLNEKTLIVDGVEDLSEKNFILRIKDLEANSPIFNNKLTSGYPEVKDINQEIKFSQGLQWKDVVTFAGRKWEVDIYPTADYFAHQQLVNIWFILAGTLFFVGFFGGFLIVMSSREAMIKRVVEEKTKDLVESRRAALDLAKQEQISIEKISLLNSYQKALLENSGFSIISTDIKGIIKVFNLSAERMLGYRASEMIDKLTPAVIHDKDEVLRRAQEFSREMKIQINPGFDVFVVRSQHNLPNTYEWTYVRKDGSRLQVLLSVSALRDEKGVIYGYLGVASDITDLKETQRELFSLSQRFDLAKRSAHLGVWDWDVVNNVLIWDEQMYKIYGIKKEDFKGAYEAWQASVVPEDLLRSDLEIQQALKGEKDFDTEFRVQWPDKAVHYIKAQAIVTRDASGKPVRMTGLNKDITDQKLIEIKTAEAMNVKSDFISMVSHELRTPLTIIKESMGIVYDQTAGSINPDQKDFSDTAKRNVDRLARLINDVLDYQKLEAHAMIFKMSKHSINDIIKEVGQGFKLAIEQKGLLLEFQLQEDLPLIDLDRDKIIQVLTNLLNNATKFAEKGAICLKSEWLGKNAIKVSVQDEGIGIKPEDLDKLFKSFSQISTGMERKTGGTGLGLVLSKKIIEEHHGKINISSVYGEGAVFYFVLPVQDRRTKEIGL